MSLFKPGSPDSFNARTVHSSKPYVPHLLNENVVGCSIKSLAEIKMSFIYCSMPVHIERHFIIIEDSHANQACFSLDKLGRQFLSAFFSLVCLEINSKRTHSILFSWTGMRFTHV